MQILPESLLKIQLGNCKNIDNKTEVSLEL